MTVILLRHGRSTSNTAHTLAGRSEGVDLDDKGREQAEALVDAIGDAAGQGDRAVAAAALRAHRGATGRGARAGAGRRGPALGGRLRRSGPAARSAIWSRSRCGRWCSSSPARRCSPTGRGWPSVQARAVAAVREHDRGWPTEHGGDVLWVACTHGDVIKAVVADALGTHLDSFQRITADPASMSVIRYTAVRPFVHARQPHRRRTDGRPARQTGAAPATPSSAVPRTEPAPAALITTPAANAGILEGAMARAIHVFRSPDRFVAGTVGQPGNRTFYLQAVHDKRVVSVMLEKQQVAVLAERIAALLLEINRRFGTPIPPETGDVEDLSPLVTPVDAEFRVGTMGLGWDSEAQTVVVELLAVVRNRVRRVGGARRRRGRPRRRARVPDARSRRASSRRAPTGSSPRAVRPVRCATSHSIPRGTSACAPTVIGAARWSGPTMTPTPDERARCCVSGELTVIGRIRSASNATFLCEATPGRPRRCTACTSRSQARRRCGTFPTARWPAVSSARTWCRPRWAGTSCPTPSFATVPRARDAAAVGGPAGRRWTATTPTPAPTWSTCCPPGTLPPGYPAGAAGLRLRR